MTVKIRATRPEELRTVAATVAAALLFPVSTDDEWAKRESSWIDGDSISAWDGERCVGHVGAFRFDTSVPGGARLATCGVTRVGVLPTYTRQGLLSTMMRDLLTAARERGAPLASLRASEAVIYERYGFGVAGETATAQITTRSAGAVCTPAPGSIRLLQADEVVEVAAEIYERCARWRTGTISRSPWMWKRYLADAISMEKPSHVAVHLDPAGVLDGFVHYDVRWREGDGAEGGAGEIHDLFGADAAVERALWQYILGIDLIREWRAEIRPIDDPIRFAVRDTRAYRVRDRYDEQWLRLLDVDTALASRAFGPCARAVCIAVTDPMFPDNCGTWTVGAAGASRTTARPDLAVEINVMSAAYLGGTSWRELADAGRVEVLDPDAIHTADTLFVERPAPFCGSFF